jgi:hypothetical protein
MKSSIHDATHSRLEISKSRNAFCNLRFAAPNQPYGQIIFPFPGSGTIMLSIVHCRREGEAGADGRDALPIKESRDQLATTMLT